MTEQSPSLFPEFIFGIHGAGGADLLMEAGRIGWIMESVQVNLDVRQATGQQFSDSNQCRTIVRINADPPDMRDYTSFAHACATFVANSDGCHHWIIDCEIDNASKPTSYSNVRSVEEYRQLYSECRAAIKAIPGNEDELVYLAAPRPSLDLQFPREEMQGRVQYFRDVLAAVKPEGCDGIVLRSYTSSQHINEVTGSPSARNLAQRRRRSQFLSFMDFMEAIPDPFRNRPVIIMEFAPGWEYGEGWGRLPVRPKSEIFSKSESSIKSREFEDEKSADTSSLPAQEESQSDLYVVDFVLAAYNEVANWNADTNHQAIQGLLLYQWKHPLAEWSIRDHPSVINSLQQVLKAEPAEKYRVRIPEPLSQELINISRQTTTTAEPRRGTTYGVRASTTYDEGSQTNVADDVYVGDNAQTDVKFMDKDKIVRGDDVLGDKVGGDKILVDYISGSTDIAIGRNPQTTINQGLSSADATQRAAEPPSTGIPSITSTGETHLPNKPHGAKLATIESNVIPSTMPLGVTPTSKINTSTEANIPVNAEKPTVIKPEQLADITTEDDNQRNETSDDGMTQRNGEDSRFIATPSITVINQLAERFTPPPPSNKVIIEIAKETVKLVYAGNTYSCPNRLKSDELLAARLDKEEYGNLLFSGLIHSIPSAGQRLETTTLRGYNTALENTQHRLSVELQLDPNEPELHLEQWEYLHEPGKTPLAILERSPFYRHVEGPSRQLRVEDNKLKVLVVICNPPTLGKPGSKNDLIEGLVALDLAQEREIMIKAFSQLRIADLLEYKILDQSHGGATLDAVIDALQEGYHVLHLIAHGVQNKVNEFCLVMEDANKKHKFVTAEEFQRKIDAVNQSLRLVVLAACQSAVTSSGETLLGLGARLVRAGIPAVVAMQEKVPISTAQLFAQHFYDDLARSGQLDMAMAATRLSIYQKEGEKAGTWGIPVLFMSTDDGKLFDVDFEKDKERVASLPRLITTPQTTSESIIKETNLPTMPKRGRSAISESGSTPYTTSVDTAATANTDTVSEVGIAVEANTTEVKVDQTINNVDERNNVGKPVVEKGLGQVEGIAITPPDLQQILAPSTTIINQLIERYIPPPPSNKVVIEVSKSTVKLTYAGNTYTCPNRLKPEELLAARLDKEDYGNLLFSGLIHNIPSLGQPLETTTSQGFGTALINTQRRLQVELQLDPNESDLHLEQWEYLHEPGKTPLAILERSPFYRRVEGPTKQLHVEDSKLKVLVVICNPLTLGKSGNGLVKGLVALDLAQEREIMIKAFSQLRIADLLEYKILDQSHGGATLDVVIDALQEGYHVLHLIAHGVQNGVNEFCLVMEDANKKHKFVTAEEFQRKIDAVNRSLRLVVLAACQSAVTSSGETLLGLGARLVRAGIPAVVAMQEKVPISTAQLFAQHFYDDLARSGQLDMAMAATRLSIYQREGEESGTWGIPVLFMSTDDGKLLDIDREKAASLPELKATPHGSANLVSSDPQFAQIAQTLQAKAQMLDGPGFATALQQAIPNTGKLDGSPVLAIQQRRTLLTEKLRLDAIIDPFVLATFVKNAARLELPPSLFSQVAAALNTGKHLILTGPPGTGKTSLANAIACYAKTRGFCTGTTFATATADWTTFDTIGGYVPTANQTLQFRPGNFLRAICNGEWLVIDEINRAEIDKAMGELFTVLSGQRVDLPYLIGEQLIRILPAELDEGKDGWIPLTAFDGDYSYVVHPNWRVIGTMNVYDRASLFSMSLAFMRRFAFVEVELPDEDTLYRPLRDKWIDAEPRMQPIGADPDVVHLKSKLAELFARPSMLMDKRSLGPAIARDMIRFIRDRYRLVSETGESIEMLLAEAFLLFAVPQLDGLDQPTITVIYKDLVRILGESAGRSGILHRIKGLYPYISDEAWQ